MGHEIQAQPSAWSDGATATFRVPDPEGRLAGVRLRQELRIHEHFLGFAPVDGGWTLVIDRPPVNRMEYLLEYRYPDGHDEVGTDPGNPRQAAGAFGPKSVLEFPGYAPPAWLTAPAEPGISRDSDTGAIEVRAWSPPGTAADEPLPLLVVNDGPEYDSLASLTRYLEAGVTGHWLPRLRAALLTPGDRNRRYSASPSYAAGLAEVALPATTRTIGMGTSLGALAMLHAHTCYPARFDALFLQSGSFFTPRFDAHEHRFPYYPQVVSFVASAAARLERPIPVALTCGAIEENIENNRLMTQTLRSRGYPATLHEVPDVHNYTAWRDAFDPHLTRLLQQVCR
jgi:enterochelin esterase-like enzyme